MSVHKVKWLLLCGGWLLIACTDSQPFTPKSGGRPYEVLVIGDVTGTIAPALSSPIEGLPQAEPLFDVSVCHGLNSTTRMARNIVAVTIDSTRYHHVKLRYERNLYATPQIMVWVTSPSTTALRLFMKHKAALLTSLLTQQEMLNEQAVLTHKHNTKATAAVIREFGFELLPPTDLTAMKRGHNFLWLSDDGKTVNRSLCIYTLPKGDFATMRDSMMRANLPGECPGMVMQTVSNSLKWQQAGMGSSQRKIVRGQWVMHDDAMGGPFVAHLIDQGDSMLVAEAFVYAPGTKKRNKLRLLEAALYTLKTNKKNNGK